MSARVVLRREWFLHGSLPRDFLAVSLSLGVLFDVSGPKLLLLLGALFVGILGPRLAGDERLNGTLEFVLTRPMDRGRWLHLRFGFGALLLIGGALLCAGMDRLDAHQRFASLLAEPIVPRGTSDFPGPSYLCVTAALLLMYSITWWSTIGERNPDTIRSVGWSAGLLAAILCPVLWIGAHLLIHPADGPGIELNFLDPSGGASASVFSLGCAALAGGAFLLARRKWCRLEVTEAVRGGSTRPGSGGLWIAVLLLVVLLLVLAFFFLSARDVAVDGPIVTTTPAQGMPR